MEKLTDFDRWCDLMDLDPEALRADQPAADGSTLDVA
jgi:hypothetical protein